eukprot:COSAG04_NODE_4155_length_2266_cov_1.691278_2_plen_465_part_00
MSQPPAKRHKPVPPRAAEPDTSDASADVAAACAYRLMPPPEAAATAIIPRNAIIATLDGIPSVTAVAALDAQLVAFKGQRQEELKRKRDEFEADIARKRAALTRELVQFKRQHAEEQRQLARQIAPLQEQRDVRGGYLRLVNERLTPVPARLPADAPPTALHAAQRRLAMASLGSARLGAAATLLSDVAELVSHHIRGFDLVAENAKARFGPRAFSARAQFRQLSGMREAVVGVLIEGHPVTGLNGVYRVDSEHEGWPVLKNAGGVYCYRYPPKDQWFLSSHFTPDERKRNSYIVAKEGPLPAGAHTWRVRDEGKWERRTLTASLLIGPAVAVAEARVAAEAAAANGAQLAAVRAQLDGASGISIAGHPTAAFNGVYTHYSTHEGWPVLKNASGMYCYRYTPEDRWFLSSTFTPDLAQGNASIVAKEGLLPVGAHTWKISASALGKPSGSGREGRTLTVALVTA